MATFMYALKAPDTKRQYPKRFKTFLDFLGGLIAIFSCIVIGLLLIIPILCSIPVLLLVYGLLWIFNESGL